MGKILCFIYEEMVDFEVTCTGREKVATKPVIIRNFTCCMTLVPCTLK